MEGREVTEGTSLVVNESENLIPKRQSRLDTCRVSLTMSTVRVFLRLDLHT